MGGLDMPFEDIKGPLSNWVTTKSIQVEIKRRFRGFLEAYKDDAEELVYKKRVRDMCVGELTTYFILAFTISKCHQSPFSNSYQFSTALFIRVDVSSTSLHKYLVTFGNRACSQCLPVEYDM